MRVLAFPDLHCPYENPAALSFLKSLNKDYKPDKVVNLGDEIDAAAWSRFPKDPEGDSPGREIERARESLRPFYELFPKTLVCESNHTLRPFKRAAEAGLPRSFLSSLRSVLRAPRGWKWQQGFTLDSVYYFHGEGFSGKNAALTAAERYRCSVVMGHVHGFAGIQWICGQKDRIFGACAGCLIDPGADAFAYAKHYANRPMLGAMLITDGIPQYVPM